MINSASGRVYLAFSEPEERERLLAEIAAGADEGVKEKIAFFRKRMDEIRSEGVEEDDEEQYEGIRCIAAPVLDGENTACGAVSVSIPTLRYDDDLVAQDPRNRGRAGRAHLAPHGSGLRERSLKLFQQPSIF